MLQNSSPTNPTYIFKDFNFSSLTQDGGFALFPPPNSHGIQIKEYGKQIIKDCPDGIRAKCHNVNFKNYHLYCVSVMDC